MSYSLYLWQQPFLDRASDAAIAAFPLNILCAVTLAVGSYYLVERPALSFRKSLERALFAPRATAEAPMPAPATSLDAPRAS